MEIQIFNPTNNQPLPQVQWNYPELKAWLTEGLKKYDGVVYDDNQITQAKKDRANLNKLADAIDSKRNEMKAMYLQPYEEFEAQAKELTAMVKTVAGTIADQINAYDEFRKSEKLEKIKAELYAPMIDGLADLIPYDKLHDKRWLNVTYSMTAIGTEIAQKIERIVAGLEAIDKMNLDSALTEQTKTTFLEDFNLAAAIQKTERILEQRAALERLKADAEAKKAAESENAPAPKYTPLEAETPTAARFSDDNTAEPIHTVVFRIRVTESKLKLLGQFMRENGIRPERV